MTAKSGRNRRHGFVPTLPPFGDRRRVRIGLLGGSFNPAHEGHLHISEEARRRLKLHQVWWLVSPQNPLKPAGDMAPLAKRQARASDLARKPYLVVTDLEQRLGVTHTVRTLRLLRQRYPGAQFVWLMGADNLSQLPLWWRWIEIFRTVRVAVLDRSPYSYKALAGVAARRFAGVRTRRSVAIWFRSLPAWTYIAIRRHPASGTQLRAEGRRP